MAEGELFRRRLACDQRAILLPSDQAHERELARAIAEKWRGRDSEAGEKEEGE